MMASVYIKDFWDRFEECITKKFAFSKKTVLYLMYSTDASYGLATDGAHEFKNAPLNSQQRCEYLTA